MPIHGLADYALQPMSATEKARRSVPGIALETVPYDFRVIQFFSNPEQVRLVVNPVVMMISDLGDQRADVLIKERFVFPDSGDL
jgi:hypothetical protein